MGQVLSSGCLSHGHHKGVELQIVGDRRKNSSKTLAMEGMDFGCFPGNSEVPWESAFERTGVHGCQVVLKSNL